MMGRYSEGDWVKYRHHEGWTTDGKILEMRPDDVFVVGSHDKDPNPDHVKRGDVIGMVE